MDLAKADIVRRALAHFLDAVVAATLSMIFVVLVPVVGGILGALYTLFRDAILFELFRKDEWHGRSIGKKLMRLQVVQLGGERVTMVTSVKRNAPLVAATFATMLPLIGSGGAALFGLILIAVEVVLVLTDRRGRRLGDRWADTQVVAAKEPEATALLE